MTTSRAVLIHRECASVPCRQSRECEALFDKTFVTHVEIVPYIKECLRSRLKLDFVRLGEAAFLAQWCSSPPLKPRTAEFTLHRLRDTPRKRDDNGSAPRHRDMTGSANGSFHDSRAPVEASSCDRILSQALGIIRRQC
ncbi:hypothetical protein Bbelb_031420 [Branchiostoma belcheri]|nr:hypothetical protein Bbelb_031420 [Branchiostoma belcheri]